VNDGRCLIDGTELLDDAISKFAAMVAEGRYEEAEQFASLAFYLIQHRVHEGMR
jgi:hypothetical protein